MSREINPSWAECQSLHDCVATLYALKRGLIVDYALEGKDAAKVSAIEGVIKYLETESYKDSK